ncbi:MAG TPA: hypothetical protein VJS64_15235 [Pyrinomonadaceae bacterium]|nr:hypothetical protein [Pyrinomonadaceae bacterium]
MIPRINISAGDFELIKPAVLFLSALLSTWVFASARKRFSFLVALLWALASFFLTLIVLPLYLIVLLGRRGTSHRQVSWKLIAPLIYALLVIAGISFYLYKQSRGVDVHLARAAHAKLRGNHLKAIAEYRAALREEDDPHTRKLLGIELFESDQWTEALSELRRAERDGEQDDLVILRIASLLDTLGQPNQAQLEYRRFLESPLCTQPATDRRCETVRRQLNKE